MDTALVLLADRYRHWDSVLHFWVRPGRRGGTGLRTLNAAGTGSGLRLGPALQASHRFQPGTSIRLPTPLLSSVHLDRVPWAEQA